MSRSRRPQCSGGRGCRVCGDAGHVARKRDADAVRVDAADIEAEIEDLNNPDDGYECDGRDCIICSRPAIDASDLPPGVTFVEAL